MTTRLTQPIALKLDDPATERVRASITQAIRELQSLPAVSLRVIGGVVLPNATAVFVVHKLGRVPTFVGPSAIRGAVTAGVISDFGAVDPAGRPVDQTQVVCLVATSYGATITVDLLVGAD